MRPMGPRGTRRGRAHRSLASGSDLDYLLRRAIPDALDPIVRRAVGTIIPRDGEEGRYRIEHTGRFSSRIAGDLLMFFRNQRLDGALIVIDVDVTRAIYFREGRVVGASSDCVFEQLGRVLRRAERVSAEVSERLCALEETGGLDAAVRAVIPDLARWGVETRVWEVVAALFFVHGGHFVIVEGAPNLGDVPALDLAPTDLAIEGLRRYDEWRNGKPQNPPPQTPRRTTEAAPPATTSPTPSAPALDVATPTRAGS